MEEHSQVTVDYSIIIPVYFNEGTLFPTMEMLRKHVIEANPKLSYEVIFIDDGSKDSSFNELMQIREHDKTHIKVIKLTRNFGQVSALYAGFSLAQGRCVVAISADGQDPPDLISEMLRVFFNESTEIVVCMREDRDETWLRKITSKIFYYLMRKLSFPNMPAGGFDFFLVGQRALKVMMQAQEAHPFLQGQILWTGFDTKFIGYKRRRREIGKSRWTLGKKITYLIDGVMSYSFLPIRLMSMTGALIALAGFFYAVIILINKLVWNSAVEGWTPLMIVTLVLSGIQLLTLGVIGEYVWRTLAQARNRHPYVIEAIYN